MFGGHGLYLDGTIVGIVIDELLYLKVDDANREDYLAAGATPFIYQGRDRLVTTSYWADIFDDDDTLRRWIAAAHGAARRTHRPARRARR